MKKITSVKNQIEYLKALYVAGLTLGAIVIFTFSILILTTFITNLA